MGDRGPQQPGVDQVAEHLQGAVVRSEEGPPPGQPAAGPRVVGEEGGQARHGARHQAQPDRGHQVGDSYKSYSDQPVGVGEHGAGEGHAAAAPPQQRGHGHVAVNGLHTQAGRVQHHVHLHHGDVPLLR